MPLNDPLTAALFGAVMLLCASMFWLRQRSGLARPKAAPADALDTVNDWPPQAARVLTIAERQAIELVRAALPGFLVLGQVPLSRFLRVPDTHSQGDWLKRVGNLSADLVVCDMGSRVMLAVDIRSSVQAPRSRKRHERMSRVLRAAGIAVQVWYEDHLPTPAEARRLLTSELMVGPARAAVMEAAAATSSRPMPLIPIAETSESDLASYQVALEPLPSGFYEEPS